MLSRVFRSKDYGFFELFEKHSSTAIEASRTLHELLGDISKLPELSLRLEEYEHRCDTYTHMTIDMLHKCFVTPLDRDEIVRLISALDDVVDGLHLVVKRIQLYEVDFIPETMTKFGEVLVQGVEKIAEMVRLIPALKDEQRIRQLGEEIHRLENQGDQLFIRGISLALKECAQDALRFVKYKDIYEILEMATDRVEDVSNIIEGIFLEHN